MGIAAIAVAGGAASPVAAVGAVHTAAAHAPTYRVLSSVETRSRVHARVTSLEYLTPHTRYLLSDQYSGRRISYISWQKDVLGGKRRPVDRVLIDPARKTYTEQKTTVPPLPPTELGIDSTAARVQQAIQDHQANEDGLGMKDGQRVRLLTLRMSSHVRSDALWVNPATDQPVAQTKTFNVGGGNIRTVQYEWKNESASALKRLTTKPKVPAGYTRGN